MLPTAEQLWNDPNFIQYRIYGLRRYLDEFEFPCVPLSLNYYKELSRPIKVWKSAKGLLRVYEERLQLLRSMGL